MEPDEIRAEIERRRKRAIDLKLREALWALYDSHLRYYAEKSKNDPEMIYPDIKDTIEMSGGQIQFKFRDIAYKVSCKEGPPECESYCGSRRGEYLRRDENNPYNACPRSR